MPAHTRTTPAVIAAAVMLAALLIAGCTNTPGKSVPVVPKDGAFTIDASPIGPGEVRFFHFVTGEKKVVFLVARTASGELKTAFDACITCYPHKKGYNCEDTRVVCVHCSTAFELEELGVGRGNCVPIKIDHRVSGSFVIIDQSDIVSGSRWF